MKKLSLIASLILTLSICFGQDFQEIDVDSEVTHVQPMTGIVYWPTNWRVDQTDAIALEFSYMKFEDIVTGEDTYDWTVVEELLDDIASRNHQAILRFRYAYPGRTTTVPQYIKDLPDYNETEGVSEGKTTWFPDWTHPELQDMTLKFYTAYAERYDNDPRLAFVQVGFGLWAEYHIYSGPFELGVTFPSKDFQKTFFDHLESVFINTYWNISIDAASATYSPFSVDTEYLDIDFGMFDDSFMHQGHSGYNESSWNFFDRERFRRAPAGGEFSYYSSFDQRNVLNPDEGAYGIPYEEFANDFHVTYMIGNDQGKYHDDERIKAVSLASGYKFKLESVLSKPDSTIIEISNKGVAPLYVDAYLTVDGLRCSETLKFLAPDSTKVYHIGAGGNDPVITIESDDILDTEAIQFYGTANEYERYSSAGSGTTSSSDIVTPTNVYLSIYPNVTDQRWVNVEQEDNQDFEVSITNIAGGVEKVFSTIQNGPLDLKGLAAGVYIAIFTNPQRQVISKKLVLK